MLEAKDTITKTTIYNCHNTLEERLTEQAEKTWNIAFPAGKRKGRKEVVEELLRLTSLTGEGEITIVIGEDSHVATREQLSGKPQSKGGENVDMRKMP